MLMPMAVRRQAFRSIRGYLLDALRPVAPSERRATSYPLEVKLSSGRITEHREAAERLSHCKSQQERADTIARALVLMTDIELLIQRCPGILDLDLESLERATGKGGSA